MQSCIRASYVRLHTRFLTTHPPTPSNLNRRTSQSFTTPEDFGVMVASVVRGAALIQMAARLKEQAGAEETARAMAMLEASLANEAEERRRRQAVSRRGAACAGRVLVRVPPRGASLWWVPLSAVDGWIIGGRVWG